MAAMSPGREKLLLKTGAATRYKLGQLKFAKVFFIFFIIFVCIIIFYINSNFVGIFGRRLFSNRTEKYGSELFISPLDRENTNSMLLPKRNVISQGVLDKMSYHHQQQQQPEYAATSSLSSSMSSKKSFIFKTILLKPAAYSARNASVQAFPMSSNEVIGIAGGNGDFAKPVSDFNIFVIYTKENYQLHVKFQLFAKSLLKYSNSGALLHLHVLTDETSGNSVEHMLKQEVGRYRRSIIYSLYNLRLCSEQIEDIVSTMTPYFSSTPKSYYSDSLFFLSLGLHRIASTSIERAILLDCDIVFRTDVLNLFNEFEHFTAEHLFGLSPELTPVYRHILYRYRANYPKTDFGSPFYLTNNEMHNLVSEESVLPHHKLKLEKHHGYPGLNSGVVLLHLKQIRESNVYRQQLRDEEVRKLTSNYMFRGHLGDQDFFTLIGYEFPHLIYRLDCVWNRQLCTWWKDHGYSDVFDKYFTCKGRIRMYHGNCNARVPE